MSENRHLKASDVFNNTEHFLGEKTTFAKAFPTIEEIKVKAYETDFGTKVRDCYYSPSHGEFIDCGNPRCYNGGLHVGNLIRNMVYGNETELEGTFSCQGYEGSPKGRIKRGPCFHSFHLKIDIKYRPQIDQNKEKVEDNTGD